MTVAGSPEPTSPVRQATRPIAVAALAVVLAVWGYLRSSSNRSAFDDAFISFRYAQNLIDGHGLVGGDFMEYRLLWEYWPVLVVGGALGALESLRRNLVLTVVGAAS